MYVCIVKANINRTLMKSEGLPLPETLATGPPPLLQLPLTITHFSMTLQGCVSQNILQHLIKFTAFEGRASLMGSFGQQPGAKSKTRIVSTAL